MNLSEEEELDYSDGEIEDSQEHGANVVKHETKEGQGVTPTDLINDSKVIYSSNNDIFKAATTTVVEHLFKEEITLGVVVDQEADLPPSPKEVKISTLTLSKAATSYPAAYENDNDLTSTQELNVDHSSGGHMGKHVKVMNIPEEEEFTCYFCQCTFKTMVDLRYHIADHTKEKIYKCFCTKAFINREEATLHLQVHMAAIEGGLNFLQRKIQVELPFLLSDDNNDTENEELQEEYEDEGTSSDHDSFEEKDLDPINYRPRPPQKFENSKILRPYRCNKCGKSYMRKRDLLRHEESVHLGIRFKCLECGNSYTRNSHLTRHKINVHSNLRKFKCLECGKSFNDIRNLRQHKNNVHLNLRKYKCLECGKAFYSTSHLARHKNTVHSNLRKFKCLECGKAFHTKSHLNRHINSVHSGLKKEQCPECRQFYSSKTTLQMHIDSAHNGQFVEMEMT